MCRPKQLFHTEQTQDCVGCFCIKGSLVPARAVDSMSFVPLGDVLTNSGENSSMSPALPALAALCPPRAPLLLPALLRFLCSACSND